MTYTMPFWESNIDKLGGGAVLRDFLQILLFKLQRAMYQKMRILEAYMMVC